MLSSDDCPKPHGRFLKKVLSQDDEVVGRVPPASDKLVENLPWLNIMADLALTAAIAEFKVSILHHQLIKMIRLSGKNFNYLISLLGIHIFFITPINSIHWKLFPK